MPKIRATRLSKALYVYPTRMLDIDFPSVMLGLNLLSNGKFGVVSQVGFLTEPGIGNPEFQDRGQGKYPVRGLELGLEGRYYVSPLRVRFPFYVGASLHYANAPLVFSRYVRNEKRHL